MTVLVFSAVRPALKHSGRKAIRRRVLGPQCGIITYGDGIKDAAIADALSRGYAVDASNDTYATIHKVA